MDNNLNRVLDQVKPSPEQKEAMLSRLLEPERKVTPMKNLKKLVIIGIAAALMVISCAAVTVIGMDQRLLEYFGGTPEDSALLSQVAVEVGASHTYDSGWTVEISQVLADRLSLAVLVDVTAPEGTVLSKEEQFTLGIAQLDGQGERIINHTLLGFIRQLDDGVPDDNHMTVLWQVRKTQGEASVPYTASALKLIPGGVRFREGDRMVPVWFNSGDSGEWHEWWSCTVQMPDADPGITCSVDQPVTIKETRVTLSGVYLSPLSVTVYVRDEAEALRSVGWIEWEGNVFLNRMDGTQIAATGTQGSVEGVSYTFCFDQILDTEKVVSITLFGQTFDLK